MFLGCLCLVKVSILMLISWGWRNKISSILWAPCFMFFASRNKKTLLSPCVHAYTRILRFYIHVTEWSFPSHFFYKTPSLHPAQSTCHRLGDHLVYNHQFSQDPTMSSQLSERQSSNDFLSVCLQLPWFYLFPFQPVDNISRCRVGQRCRRLPRHRRSEDWYILQKTDIKTIISFFRPEDRLHMIVRKLFYVFCNFHFQGRCDTLALFSDLVIVVKSCLPRRANRVFVRWVASSVRVHSVESVWAETWIAVGFGQPCL